jgi:hypothetical protein
MLIQPPSEYLRNIKSRDDLQHLLDSVEGTSNAFERHSRAEVLQANILDFLTWKSQDSGHMIPAVKVVASDIF